MRVALISSEFAGLPGSGGIGSYFDHLARGLVRVGCEVEIFTSGNPGDLPTWEGVVFHHIGDGSPPLFSHRVVEAFGEVHRQRPFDILEYGELNAEGVLAAREFPKVARVVRLHSPTVILDRYLDFAPSRWSWFLSICNQIRSAIGASRRGLPFRPINLEPFYQPWPDGRDNVECHAAAESDVVVVMSEEMRRFAEGHWWIKPDAIRQVPNPYFALDHETGVPEISHRTKKIGFLGRLEVRKGAVELAQALLGLLPSFPDWKVAFVGSEICSSWSGKNPRLIAEEILAPVCKQVEFLPRIAPDQVGAWFSGIDLFAFPSLWDNFPYVILEAMASGKPIVATRTGTVPEMLSETAMLVPPGDVKALARALRRLMADSELRSKLGAAARKRFEERYNPDRVMGEILEVYREAALRAEVRRSKIGDRGGA